MRPCQSHEIDLPDSIAAPGAQVSWLVKVNSFCEGPAIDKSGVLYFSEIRGNDQMSWPIWRKDTGDVHDEGKPWVVESFQANGLAFDSEWRLLAAQKERISRFKPDGTLDAILVESGKDGVEFNQANDLSIAADGSIYFTDLGTKVFYLDRMGNLRVVYDGAGAANGIEFIEEESRVYVNEFGTNQVSRFETGEDGVLRNRTTFVEYLHRVDGATFDSVGNFYAANYAEGKVQVFSPAGEPVGSITIHTPEEYDARPGPMGNASNCAFGGPENKTLFITGDGGVYAIRLEIAGRRRP
jgi:gluconolactonase